MRLTARRERVCSVKSWPKKTLTLFSLAMPPKQVQFSRTNRVQLYIPPPPSPCCTLSTLPSEDGPITPTREYAYPYQKVFQPRDPLPPPPRQPRMNNILALSPNSLIHYDLTLSPRTFKIHQQALSYGDLAQSAVLGPTAMKYITLVSPYLPRKIGVFPEHNGSYVTVVDVLNCLYNILQGSVTEAEYKAIPSDLERYWVATSYEMRCRRSYWQEQYERSWGLKRVDYFMGWTRFLGLSLKGSEWVINVA